LATASIRELFFLGGCLKIKQSLKVARLTPFQWLSYGDMLSISLTRGSRRRRKQLRVSANQFKTPSPRTRPS